MLCSPGCCADKAGQEDKVESKAALDNAVSVEQDEMVPMQSPDVDPPKDDIFGSTVVPEKNPEGEDLIGDWQTKKGKYSVNRDKSGQLIFKEDRSPELILVGILKKEGDCMQAEIKDELNKGATYGHLRMKREGDNIRSFFRFTEDEPWDDVGYIASRQ
mmetsp:Transcript_31813/g.80447  ORF Transcript_31813/g.80447 Transcript_31813/m.80447 type:complete len:159 (+) Transcript_31813:116-592(+)